MVLQDQFVNHQFDRVYSGLYYQIKPLNGGGSVISRSLYDHTLSPVQTEKQGNMMWGTAPGPEDQTLRVEDLAAQAAMSVTSFHRHFRALTALTPIQFQKTIRLHEARARLLADPGDIAGAGHAVGYSSPSQFSREYRRMFGAPPSRDAPALRAGSRPADGPAAWLP